MLVGFCSRCQKNVPLKRKEMDVLLLIILTIFTVGFGVMIYLIFYFCQEPNRCALCDGICKPRGFNKHDNDPIRNERSNNDEILADNSKRRASILHYCPNCGSNLKDCSRSPNYCPFCGNHLENRSPNATKVIHCTICHDKVNNDKEIVRCSFCGATYHAKCVSKWLLEYHSCPLCQNVFLTPEIKIR